MKSIKQGAVLLLVLLGCASPAFAGPPAGRWRIDADIWENSFNAMAEEMFKTLPEDQRDETRMAMESQLEQLKDPEAGGLARIIAFEPDGTVSVEGGDDQVIAEGSHWEETGKTIKIATDDPTDLAFAGAVEGDTIDMHPVLDADAAAEAPWSRDLHLVLRRIR
ncbi:hypothetical protein SAMN07250955_11442 [Arboricoccus pini]|uniref:Uncharacterized protein n=1 Tax=Arboricoccus pini TaxID=1963835 RepID=A0A212RTM5_9PROT|nr:hypothetical protein [Arboricoccus pini]SNB75948.1 hypothetical protein SAMN07250955_11442 [Arboricoccus pini]